MRMVVVLLLLIQWELLAHGQPMDLHFQHLNESDGLTARYNDFIFKDSRQLIWISSINGLFCYDGIKIKHYLPDNDLGKGMLGKNIQSRFFEDADGNIWFATVEGINCYHRKENVFSHVQLNDEQGQKIKGDYGLLHLERNQTLWIKTNGQIYQYHIATKEQVPITSTVAVRFAVDTLSDGQVDRIFGCFWDKDSGFEVIEIDKDRKVKKSKRLADGWQGLPVTQIEVSGAIIQKRGTAWLFSDQGLLYFKAADQIEQYDLPSGNENIIKDGTVVDDRYLLLTAKNSGLWLFDTHQKRFVKQYAHHDDRSTSLMNDNLREVYLDPQNHLWVASRESAEIDHSWINKNTFYNPFLSFSNRLPTVNFMVEDLVGNIWCATMNEGIYLFDLQGQNKKHFPYSAKSTVDGSQMRGVHHLSIDEQGGVWALSNQFIYRFHPAKQKWQRVLDAKGKKLISQIHLSRSRKLISTNKGVFEWNVTTRQFQHQLDPEQIGNQNQQIISLFKGEAFIFVHHQINKLSIYKVLDANLHFEKELILEDEVFSVWKDTQRKIIWVGTLNGLVQVDQKDWTIQRAFTKNKLLRTSQISAITGDAEGYLWLSTNDGLWQYDILNDALLQYREADGLCSNEFSFFANIKASDQKLWLGTNKGLVVFDPKDVHPYPHGPNIQIRSLTVNQRPYAPVNNLLELKNLDLKHHQNTLGFELFGVNHYLSDLNQIHYRLKGYSEDWITIKNGAIAEFIKIPDGAYTLEIYGTNANGIKGRVKNLPIIIDSPIWKKIWFWILVLTLLGMLVYGLSHILAQQKLNQQKEAFERKQALEDALQGERNRIAGEMHDDLGTELTLIGLLLNDIPTDQLPKVASENLKKIESHATKSIENMREIIWAMNNSYDNLPDLVAFIRRFVVEIFDDSDIICKAQIPEGFPDCTVSGEKRRNILLCIKECVNNILKHADASQVNLSFKWNGVLEILLADNGRGIDLDQDKPFGNGLKNMRQRMEEVGGEIKIINEEGTKIYFSIPLDLSSEK